MKTPTHPGLVVVAALAAACGKHAPPPAAAPIPPAQVSDGEKLPLLMVLPLRSEPSLANQARALDEMMLAAIHKVGRYKAMGANDLTALLDVERMKDAVGCDDVQCAAELGGALGARFMVAGQLSRLGEQAVLSLRLLDTQAPAVLERASQRGQSDANTLARLAITAVGELFHVKLEVPDVAAAAPTTSYDEYTTLVYELARLIANSEYTAMLELVDGAEKRQIAAPPHVDLAEMLVQYRAQACFMLKRAKCVEEAVRRYQARWPKGLYTPTMQTYLDNVADQQVEPQGGGEELANRLREIQQTRDAGRVSADQALEMTAFAYLSARDFGEAARRFEELLPHYKQDADKQMDLVVALVMTLEQAGSFARARAILEQAERDHPKQFRAKKLDQTLRRLPR